MGSPLPAGLSPVVAGRLGLWLLAKRQQTAKAKRVPFPRRACHGIGGKVAVAVWPWRVSQYPGAAAMMSAICGVAHGTAANWLKGLPPSPANAERLARYLEDGAAVMVALAAELRMDRNKNRYAQRDTTVRQDGTVAIKILTNAAKSGPAPFAQAEHTSPQVNSEIFNTAPPSPQAAKRPSASKKFGRKRRPKADRK